VRLSGIHMTLPSSISCVALSLLSAATPLGNQPHRLACTAALGRLQVRGDVLPPGTLPNLLMSPPPLSPLYPVKCVGCVVMQASV